MGAIVKTSETLVVEKTMLSMRWVTRHIARAIRRERCKGKVYPIFCVEDQEGIVDDDVGYFSQCFLFFCCSSIMECGLFCLTPTIDLLRKYYIDRIGDNAIEMVRIAK